MPKPSKRVVEAADPQGRDYFLWCDELPGFGVRIFASGRRGYLVQYRASGRCRRFTIGLHGALTADEARRRRRRFLTHERLQSLRVYRESRSARCNASG